MTNKEKFLSLVSKEETKAVQRAKERLARKSYTKLSNQIALEILERIDELKWKQVTLAEKLGVSVQQVSEWVKGNENFTLETLVNLGKVLGTDLIYTGIIKEQVKKLQIKKVEINFLDNGGTVLQAVEPFKNLANIQYYHHYISGKNLITVEYLDKF